MKNKRNPILTAVLLGGVLVASACTQVYSQTPLGTPTLIPTGLFVSPYPSGQDPLKLIAELGTQTAQAQSGTVVATSGTPAAPGTATTQQSGTSAATASTPAAGTSAATTGATSSVSTLLPVTVIPGGSTFTPTTQGGSTVVVPTLSGTSAPVGPVPSSYTLQKGEWPYCIARRFNVNPDELLTLNGLSSAQSSMLMPGLVLSIPKTGNPFPADRAWHTHPSTWTVDPGDTLNSIACYYGDLDPQAIASANNLTLSSVLTTGKVLTIP